MTLRVPRLSSRRAWRTATAALMFPALMLPPMAMAQRGGGRGGGADAPQDAAPPAPLPKGPRAMMLADWYRVVNVSTPATSPDGKRVAMTVTRAVDGENTSQRDLGGEHDGR